MQLNSVRKRGRGRRNNGQMVFIWPFFGHMVCIEEGA